MDQKDDSTKKSLFVYKVIIVQYLINLFEYKAPYWCVVVTCRFGEYIHFITVLYLS